MKITTSFVNVNITKDFRNRFFLIIIIMMIIIIIDNFCIALFSGVPKLTALCNILQHFLSFTNIMHIIYDN